MAKNMHQINLLPNHGETMLVQFLNWALTIGRLLIILVETLALSVFLYRFSLDMQTQDLKDKIKVQRAIVQSFKSQEDVFRNLQSRLALAKEYNTQELTSPNILNEIIDKGRGHITFRNIYISNDVIRIEAQAPSAAPLTEFVNSLKTYSPVKSVSIDKVENKTSSAEVIVGISAYLTEGDKTTESSNDQIQTNTPFVDEKN
jgi:hypothetical protein